MQAHEIGLMRPLRPTIVNSLEYHLPGGTHRALRLPARTRMKMLPIEASSLGGHET